MDDYVRIDGMHGGRYFLFGLAYLRIDGMKGGKFFLFGIGYIRLDGTNGVGISFLG
jgi:hypothetical protein